MIKSERYEVYIAFYNKIGSIEARISIQQRRLSESVGMSLFAFPVSLTVAEGPNSSILPFLTLKQAVIGSAAGRSLVLRCPCVDKAVLLDMRIARQ